MGSPDSLAIPKNRLGPTDGLVARTNQQLLAASGALSERAAHLSSGHSVRLSTGLSERVFRSFP
jgi:hypothetical protein